MSAEFKIIPEAVIAASPEDKPAILKALADVFARAYSRDATEVLESLQEREQLGSTGFGRGVAIPHARIEGLARPMAACLRLNQPVDFDAADGMPVDLVFGLISPAEGGTAHLHALAAISRLLRDEAMHEALTEAPDEEALRGLLTNISDRDAA
ncbi:PTS sugar transporter subunit IIA [Altererythrobacter sp. ZODW24]|uniref:PTS sugar transporter subunit IIA n=1 Tax=Altererythrobacter sp. ZODW24 TaxID=2185142 RepID=UPI000DF7ED92|nr:PTS sugar transporter subunit IIA [Altererythrobacter sp. ZODW24]